MNFFKTERPIIAALLGVLLFLKLISAFSVISQVTGMIGPILGLEMILIVYVAYTLNTRAGGQSSLMAMIICMATVMVLDGVIIYISLNGLALSSVAVPRIIGAELTYILTIAYIFFSKKLRRFKGCDA